MTTSKTKTSFYRRLYIAYLIDTGIYTVPAIMRHTGIPRRTAQDTIVALAELDIECKFMGANKDGHYEIKNWGPIDPAWIKAQLTNIATLLNYPVVNQ